MLTNFFALLLPVLLEKKFIGNICCFVVAFPDVMVMV